MYHVAIIRKVKPGQESAFEEAIHDFLRDALTVPGTTGAHLIKPVHADHPQEYGILRAFEDQAAAEQFYSSERFQAWEARVADMTQGPAERRELHGMEAFFLSGGGSVVGPPRWKMAVLTWLGVNVAVYLFMKGVPAVIPGLPFLVELGIVNALVVASLTWGIMPALTGLFKGWLIPSSKPEEGSLN